MSNVIYLRVPVSTAVVAGTALSVATTAEQVFDTAAAMRRQLPDEDLLLAAVRRYSQISGDDGLGAICDAFDELFCDC